MKKIIALILPLLLLGTGANAAWKFPAKVRFETGEGFSAWTNADVAFAMGGELNRVAKSGDTFSVQDGRYAVVPMNDGKFNVVRLSGYVSCGSSFTPVCLINGRADGFDGSGRHWQFCTNDICK